MSQRRFKFKENRAYFCKRARETELFFDVAIELIEKILLTFLSFILCGKLCKPNTKTTANQNLRGFCQMIVEFSFGLFKLIRVANLSSLKM